jgi:hypothetical protein
MFSFFCNIINEEKITMVEHCEICGEELDTDDEAEGICKNCKKPQEKEEEEEYIDPGIT